MEVSLRPLRQEDLEMVRRWRNDPEVAKYMYSSGEISAEQQQAWFERVSHDPSKQYWVILQGERPVGVANLADIDHGWKKCTLGIYFGVKDIRGKGLGRKALFQVMENVFEDMGLNKLVAEAFSWNTQAISLYERMGMLREGELREEILKDDEFHDVIRLAIIRSDWEEKKAELKEKVSGSVPGNEKEKA